MNKQSKYSKKRIIFITVTLLVLCANFVSFLKTCQLALEKNQSTKYLKYIEPGYEFSDLKEMLSQAKSVGFLTNKDMSPERNDGQFLAAQYMLAPIILDLNSSNHDFVILDYTGPKAAFEKMREIKAVPIFTNPFNKILAKMP